MADKETKKKKGKGGLIFLLLLVIIAIAVLLLMHFGLLGFGGGFGFGGTGKSDTEVSSSAESESEAEPSETTVEEKTYADITVQENSYIYQNQTLELDTLKEELAKLDSSVTVRITDSNASKQAYDALTAELDAADLKYENAGS